MNITQLNSEEYFCPTPGGGNSEKIVIFTRKHWVAFIGHILLSLVVLLTPLIIYFAIMHLKVISISGIGANVLVVLMSIYYLTSLTFIFVGWVSYYYDVYILTNDQIIDITQEGFWNRKISQLSLLRVQDVSSDTKGFFPTIFHYGNVLIETAGETANFNLTQIPNPRTFAARVLELHDKLIVERKEQELTSGEGTFTPNRQPSAATPQTPSDNNSTNIK